MEKSALKEAFSEFKELKNIERDVIEGVLKEVFNGQLQKIYGETSKFDITINIDKGDCEIYLLREVVEEVENSVLQISQEEANADGDDFEIGDYYSEGLSLDIFSRRGILNLKQNLQGKIMDLQKADLMRKYGDKVGELFCGEVHQVWSKEVTILDENDNELRLPKAEQIPGEHFKKNDSIKAIIKSVEMKNNTPVITLSRISDDFLEKLFEQEVPEIYDGLITIKKVVRIPGERAKVAVESYDDRIDPIGACIGVKGTRISGIVRELRNENIDVIQWTTNKQLLIQRALTPAKISSIEMGDGEGPIKVYMQPDEVKKGIGRGGCNIRLATMLLGREIEVWRDMPKQEEGAMLEDVALDEFSNEIEGWIIDKLKGIGCDTARDVLALDPMDVARRADLEDETAEEVFKILQSEFED